jgi:hypothetical protein
VQLAEIVIKLIGEVNLDGGILKNMQFGKDAVDMQKENRS